MDCNLFGGKEMMAFKGQYYCPKCDKEHEQDFDCSVPTIAKEMFAADNAEIIVGIKKARETSVFERNIWNEAIEAAAQKINGQLDNTYYLEREIRKLKK